ncbi:hypothetical protein SVI_3525 [Shewanella violacea DSS12]|uniref:Uncharacterized protein n=1 Tax=Shewanella violacea (strain JCM 10179 / CIP 106290 / LMG 19151 / DSS12) TaxID=637905 RepID=D4ZBV1_SHEVD|nr:hypothetical protein SVI_3525 [Shewanella violacea DSS12]
MLCNLAEQAMLFLKCMPIEPLLAAMCLIKEQFD